MSHLARTTHAISLLLALIAALAAACTESAAPAACDGIDCSGAGTCGVSAEGLPLCLCDPGFRAEGTECLVVEPGRECEGVDCSGHGACIVASGEPDRPICICDDGSHNAGETGCVADLGGGFTCGAGTHPEGGMCIADEPGAGACAGVTCSGHGTCALEGSGTPTCRCNDGYIAFDGNPRASEGQVQCAPAPCLSSAECMSDEACSLDSGTCTTASPDLCGSPDDEGGSTPEGGPCAFDGTMACGTGLVCVPRGYGVNAEGVAYEAIEGACARGCDPCAEGCPTGQTCIALEAGGGFCSAGLTAPGDSTRGLAEFCGGGFAPFGSTHAASCQQLCIPADATFATVRGVTYAASPSDDCGEGDVCVLKSVASSGNRYTCVPGQLLAAGDYCGGSGHCAYPAACTLLSAPLSVSLLACGSCTASRGCPESLECFLDDTGQGHCLRDGAVPYGAPCFEDRNCEPWLECHEGSDVAPKSCLPAL